MHVRRARSRMNILKLTAIGITFYTFRFIFIYLNPEYYWQPTKAIQNDPKKDGLKRIVLWNSWFYDNNWRVLMGDESEKVIACGAKCVLSTDRRDPLRYDAFVYHGKNTHIPPKERTPNQVYVLLLSESPLHFWNRFVTGKDFYNWSATYHRNSDIHFPYLSFKKKTKPQDDLTRILMKELPQMGHQRGPNEAMIAWIVSHCHTTSRREEYVRLLQQHIRVDVFGWCGKSCKDDCLQTLRKRGQYKFYLSFENAACKDYITEKALTPLKVGWVPIVYGGLSGMDYRDKLPPHSYIDVRDFKSPKQLAEYINYLDKNHTTYLKYFRWRQNYEVLGADFEGTLCKICQKLYNVSESTVDELDFGQFWNPDTECDIKSIERLTGVTQPPYHLINL